MDKFVVDNAHDILEKVKKEVALLMSHFSGHGYDHIERVYAKACMIARQEGSNEFLVALAALLHDCDDYKFVGKEKALYLYNARKIMNEAGVSTDIQEQVCDIILKMGFSNALQGIVPTTKEGQIVSDADMLDAMGATAVVRTLEYAIRKNGIVFDKTIFPDTDLTVLKYQEKADARDTAINHFFDKLLKLPRFIITPMAHAEALQRQDMMITFLKHFFQENNCPEWVDYLEQYVLQINLDNQ